MQNTNAAATEATRQNFQNTSTSPLSEDKSVKPFLWFSVEIKKMDIRRKPTTPPKEIDLVNFSDRQKVSSGTVRVMLKKHVEEGQLPPGAVNVEKAPHGIHFSFTGHVDEGKTNSIKFGTFNISKQNIISVSDENGVLIW